MNSDDAVTLIDTAAANKLGPNRAYYYSEDEGVLEKFRPYGLPDADWQAQVIQYLKMRIKQ